MLDFNLNKDCYSCAACFNVCPKSAIKMQEDKEGFLRPVIDESKCVKCGLCEKKCIYLNKLSSNNKIEESKCYALKLKDNKDILKSASGGAFFEIAKKFIEDGNYVCGCIWNDDMEAEHILTNDINELEKMRNSKYVQSNTKKCYNEIKEKLKNGYKVLFTGVPCQIAALLAVTGENENLYTISLICEGVPSRKVWRKYKSYLEEKYNGKLINANFRNKDKYGWNMPIAKYKFDNGKEISNLSFNLDMYVSSFIAGLLMNSTCYDCSYKYNNIKADIIIGDFWKIPKDLFENQNKFGVSAVIVKTKKGSNILNKVIKKYDCKEVSIDEIKSGNPNLLGPIHKHNNRDKFYQDIDNISINENIYNNTNLKSFKKKLIRIAYKFNLIKLLK